jgi:hypothetical protein
MPQFVLIIGEDPDLIYFSAPGVPPDMDAHKVMEGLNGSRDRLKGLGHEARILLTRDATTVDAQVSEALKESRYYDVIVIGAGLRTLPPMAEQFERLIKLTCCMKRPRKRSWRLIRSVPTQTKPHCAGYHRPAHRSKVS